MKKTKALTTATLSILFTLSAAASGPAGMFNMRPKYHIGTNSGWFTMPDSALDFQITYNSWDLEKQKRIHNREISKVALEMIERAQRQIVMSAFLFDSMYGASAPEFDIVQAVATKFIEKKRANPRLNIVVILDSINRAYAGRISPVVQKFKENGIDVYYTEMEVTKPAFRDGKIEELKAKFAKLDKESEGKAGMMIDQILGQLELPKQIDGHPITVETLTGAALGKANHRKILVTDVDGTAEMKALVSSANPHNASDDSTNIGISVQGELAKFVYTVLREDAKASLYQQASRPENRAAQKYALLSDETIAKYGPLSKENGRYKDYVQTTLPDAQIARLDKTTKGQNLVRAKFVSEGQIKPEVIRLLDSSKADDEIRIQMFYLSEPSVVEAIARAANRPGRTKPILMLMDPNKDAFNSIKDGSPNRQVTAYLMDKSKNIQVRWYATHGEQNHAKVMSITNASTGKYELIEGSCNWTSKNMNDINMEANFVVDGSSRLNTKFNNRFDILYGNKEEGQQYSLDYAAFDLPTTRYMNVGYKEVKKWTSDQMALFVSNNRARISEVFERELKQIPSVDSVKASSVAAISIEKNKSDLLRIVSLLVGQDMIDKGDTAEAQNEWKAKYMMKWVDGEKHGYVGW
jgi:hypothetical protein